MSKIAKDNPLVLNDPAPSVYFMGLGDSSLDFDVRVYVKDLGDWLPMLHQFHRAIVETLAQANIEIPFHQWTLSELASIAYLSKYHFLRVFESILQETPGHFVQRLRLERAARMLVYHRKVSITAIAHSCGFGSSQSLARAFRSRFLTSPSNFRRANVYRFTDSVMRPESNRVWAEDMVGIQQAVKIVERPSAGVAYIRHLGPYGAAELDAFSQLKRWLAVRGMDPSEVPFVCIGWDNQFITPHAQTRYDVGVPVSEDVRPDNIVDVQQIPAGTYAVLQTRVARGTGLVAWEKFMEGWLAHSNYQVDFRPNYERYVPARNNPGQDTLLFAFRSENAGRGNMIGRKQQHLQIDVPLEGM